jgi:hypothetical protein
VSLPHERIKEALKFYKVPLYLITLVTTDPTSEIVVHGSGSTPGTVLGPLHRNLGYNCALGGTYEGR